MGLPAYMWCFKRKFVYKNIFWRAKMLGALPLPPGSWHDTSENHSEPTCVETVTVKVTAMVILYREMRQMHRHGEHKRTEISITTSSIMQIRIQEKRSVDIKTNLHKREQHERTSWRRRANLWRLLTDYADQWYTLGGESCNKKNRIYGEKNNVNKR